LILEKICGSENPTKRLAKYVTIEKLKPCAASVGLQGLRQEAVLQHRFLRHGGMQI
jgi:hypothetical protein